MRQKNFAQVVCERLDVPADKFCDAVLRRGLYFHARFLVPLCFCFRLRWLDADREILTDLGGAASVEDMKRILSLLPWYYGRGWKFRQRLRLRLSSRKLVNLASRLGLGKPGSPDSVRLGGEVASSASSGEAHEGRHLVA